MITMSRFSQSKEVIAKNIIDTLSIRPKSDNANIYLISFPKGPSLMINEDFVVKYALTKYITTNIVEKRELHETKKVMERAIVLNTLPIHKLKEFGLKLC